MKFKIRFGFQIPLGAPLAIFIFIWTTQNDFWSKLNWFSAGLFGIALIILFLSNPDFKR